MTANTILVQTRLPRALAKTIAAQATARGLSVAAYLRVLCQDAEAGQDLASRIDALEVAVARLGARVERP